MLICVYVSMYVYMCMLVCLYICAFAYMFMCMHNVGVRGKSAKRFPERSTRGKPKEREGVEWRTRGKCII